MRRITLWLVTTAAAVVLLFSYRTSTMGANAPAAMTAAGGAAPGIVSGPTPQPAASGPPNRGSQPQTTPGADPSGTATALPSAGTVSKSGSDLVVNGSLVTTQWGPVQVQAHLSGGRITDVTALKIPNAPFDAELNATAATRLRAKALAAQSANIDVVTGATETSEGYRTSLQAALDSVHFTANR